MVPPRCPKPDEVTLLGSVFVAAGSMTSRLSSHAGLETFEPSNLFNTFLAYRLVLVRHNVTLRLLDKDPVFRSDASPKRPERSLSQARVRVQNSQVLCKSAKSDRRLQAWPQGGEIRA